jgi:hypothetical protein
LTQLSNNRTSAVSMEKHLLFLDLSLANQPAMRHNDAEIPPTLRMPRFVHREATFLNQEASR